MGHHARLGSMDNTATNRERGIPDMLWTVLIGHRWHATSLNALRGIVDTGAIEIRSGNNSLCKSLGAISLFDFGPTAEDIESLGHWSEWCGNQQASRPRQHGIPEKRVGLWLRIRDGYADERLIDANTLRGIWKKNRAANIIPGVEGGHLGPLAIAELDQILAISALEMTKFEIWDDMPSTPIIKEASLFIESLPAEPLSHAEQVAVRLRAQRAR